MAEELSIEEAFAALGRHEQGAGARPGMNRELDGRRWEEFSCG